MCPCYKEECFATGNDYIKQSIHFKSKCCRKHSFMCFSAKIILLELDCC